jgi:hypothetical protein
MVRDVPEYTPDFFCIVGVIIIPVPKGDKGEETPFKIRPGNSFKFLTDVRCDAACIRHHCLRILENIGVNALKDVSRTIGGSGEL